LFHIFFLALYKVNQQIINLRRMQLFLQTRRIATVIIVIAAVSMFVSCGGSKKYGCPNHLFAPTLTK